MKDQQVIEASARPHGAAAFLSDERLARRAAKADRHAFAAIYERYSQEIYGFCLSLLGNAEDARDALQNTMVKALQALPGERRSVKLRPWLYSVAHNQAVDMLRQRPYAKPLDPELPAPGNGLAETSASRERLRQLLSDLGELPERHRAALLMRELGGLEFAQIGEALGGSEAVARQAVYEARLGLRRLEAGREMSCEEVMHRLSNADGRTVRSRTIQAHLRSCPECRAFRESIETRREDLASLAPLPALASAGILHAILGGGTGTASGATAAGGATVAVGAGKAVSAGLVAKSVATVAVVAAVGVSTADRSGLIDAHLPGGGGGGSAEQAAPAAGGAASEGGTTSSQQANEGGKGKGANGASKGKGHKKDKNGKAKSAKGQQGARGVPPSAAAHGQETAAAHGSGAAQAHGNHSQRGASHHGSANAHSKSRGSGHGKVRHKPPPPPPKPPSSTKSQSGSGSGKSSSKAETGGAKTSASESSP